MIPKLLYTSQFKLYTYLTFCIIFFYSIGMNAQCAGNDNNTLVCDIPDIASKTVDLAALLGPHTAGGTWTDDNFSGGLNNTTGILNAQQISRSGIYSYTYTVNNVVGCIDNSATITVTIGPYAGVGSKGNTCSDDTSYNLFQAFDIAIARPQINGTWFDDDGSGGLTGNILNATIPVPDKTYHFTYIVSGIGGCAQESKQQIEVTIVKIPKAGTATDLQLCSDQLSSYTNYNLNNSLSGQDPNGTWSQPVGINEISGPTDSTIDIQNIYNTYGPGTYSFSYTVTANRFCPRSSTVDITIEKKLDFTGITLDVDSDICENEIPTATYTGILKQVPQIIANGNYNVTYTISGVATTFTTTQNFVNGVLTFPIASSNFQQVNDYTITILNIVDAATLGICNNIMGTIDDVLHVYPIPKIDNATLTIAPVCQNEDAQVYFSGNSNLSDGIYVILYSLSGKNNANTIPPTEVTVTGGTFDFPVPKALIPIAGTTTIEITKIKNKDTGCTNSSNLKQDFIVNPLPDVSNLKVVINNPCQGDPAHVQLTGLGTLTSISIDYDIAAGKTVISQTKTLTVVSGKTTFDILATDIPNVGSTTFTITNVTNVLTGCKSVSNNTVSFRVNPLPPLPVTDAVQPFCTAINATVANLKPQGNQYQWFDSNNIPLISTTPLVSGNYFVKEVDAATKCESGLQPTNVVIYATPNIDNATLTILPIPLCQSSDATVNFSGTSNLTDGNYGIVYNLTGSNRATGISATLIITNGLGSFPISAAFITTAGNTTITITNITNTSTQCSNTAHLPQVFVVTEMPDVSNMVVTINNGCQGQAVPVQLSGLGNLTAISINYNVAGTNPIGSQTIPLVVQSGGKANFEIPASSVLNTGNNTLFITGITNTVTGCSPIMNPIPKDFAINGIPASPTADNQPFCETDHATVANLDPSGNQYKWYDSPTSTTPLASSALLVTENYYVTEADAATGCESLPTQISVLINVVPAPVLQPNGQDFCGVDKPTIQNLSNNTNSNGNLTWYDAAINGVQLANTDFLTEGFTYYGFDYSSSTKCYSNALPVTVSLTDCTATPENFFIPDGFSPNGDGVNETFQIVDIEFLYPNYTLEIFNRYGNVLFKGDINKPAWDGKNSNSSFINGDSPTGVYFYIINYNKDNFPPKQGQLYLNR